MALKVMQYRYYGEPSSSTTPAEGSAQDTAQSKSSQNYPSNLTAKKLSDHMNNVFTSHSPIYQLGVQGLPGTRFYINGSTAEPVVVGYSGIYELDIGEKMKITNLRFDAASLQEISDTPGAYLIVDILYKDDSTSDQANINAPNEISSGATVV